MNFLGYFVLLTTLLVVAHSVDNQESYGDDSFLSNLDENDSNIDFSSLTDIDDNCTPGKNQAVNGLRRRQGRICYPPKNPVKNQQPSPPEGQQNPSSGGQQMEDPNVQPKDKQSQLENRRLCPYDIYGRFRQIPVCDSGVSATRIWEQDDKTWTLVNVHLCMFFLRKPISLIIDPCQIIDRYL